MRKIIHIDMDAFYAAVEQRDNRDLKGKPVIVGGGPHSRGVVATCSYEARKFGIHSAMSSRKAYTLCPDAVFVHPRFSAYKEASKIIRAIFYEYTDLVEPMSLDEAYLDVTENKPGIQSATVIARQIREKIKEQTALTASAGVSYNKFLAKVASDYNKPDGLTVILPERANEFLMKLPIRKFYGIGRVTEKAMRSMGVETGADLIRLTRVELVAHFGKAGHYYYEIVRGIDNRPVETEWERKSYGREITLKQDVTDLDFLTDTLKEIAEEIAEMLEKAQMCARTVTLKIKYHDFKTITRSNTVDGFLMKAGEFYKESVTLLENTEAGQKSIRLIGITASNLEPVGAKKYVQLIIPFRQ